MGGGGGIEQRGKRTHEHGQQCGDCGREEDVRELNSNGKKTIKIFLKGQTEKGIFLGGGYNYK